MHNHQMAAGGGPRRVGTTTSPKPLRTEQPKSPLKPPPPTRLPRPLRTSKPPEPDVPPTKALPSPPPKPEGAPELSTEEEPPPTEPPPPPSPDAPTNTDVYEEEDPEEEDPEEEKRSDDFDDKEVDSPEDDKRIDPIPEKAGGCEPIPSRSELGSSRISRSIPKLGPFPDLGRSEEAEEEEEGKSMQEAENRMQRIVDLVMWRDVSRSALVFGMGTFFFVSSSYTSDLHLSFISVVSYVGLFYLAGIFFLSSILRRGEVDFGESKQNWLVGEEEALWVIRLFLPYVNEILTKLRALFSGDPSTTMKMAMLLFALARCGGSITIWTVGKLAFFGMFTIPRFYASYSYQISRYGAFWLERFRDAWESCTHKKVATAAAFTVFWNLSSTAARIWSVILRSPPTLPAVDHNEFHSFHASRRHTVLPTVLVAKLGHLHHRGWRQGRRRVPRRNSPTPGRGARRWMQSGPSPADEAISEGPGGDEDGGDDCGAAKRGETRAERRALLLRAGDGI